MDETVDALRRAAAGPWAREAGEPSAAGEWSAFLRALLERAEGLDPVAHRDGWLPALWATVLACLGLFLFVRVLRGRGGSDVAATRVRIDFADRISAPTRSARGLWLVWALAGACAVPAAWIGLRRMESGPVRRGSSAESAERWNLLRAFARELGWSTHRCGLAELPDGGLLLAPDLEPWTTPRAERALEGFVRRGGTLVLPITFSRHRTVLGFDVPSPRQTRRPQVLVGDWIAPGAAEAAFQPPEIVFGDAGEGRAPLRTDDGATAFVEHPLGLGLVVFVADRARDWFSDGALFRAAGRVRQDTIQQGRVHLVARLLERWNGPRRHPIAFLDPALPRSTLGELVGFDALQLAVGFAVSLAWFGLRRPRARHGFAPVTETPGDRESLRSWRLLGDDLLRAARVRLGLPPEAPPGAVVDAVSSATGMSRPAIRRIFFPASRGAAQRRERWRRDHRELRRRLSR